MLIDPNCCQLHISKLLNGDDIQVSKEKIKRKPPENSIIGVRERIFINLYLADSRRIGTYWHTSEWVRHAKYLGIISHLFPLTSISTGHFPEILLSPCSPRRPAHATDPTRGLEPEQTCVIDLGYRCTMTEIVWITPGCAKSAVILTAFKKFFSRLPYIHEFCHQTL